MLATRVPIGILLVAILLSILLLDEWLSPWFPFWFLLSMTAMAAAGIELVDLLGRTSLKPSLNAVLSGVLALTVSNWMPHISDHLSGGDQSHLLGEPGTPIASLAWPLLSFVGVLMLTFIIQAVRFDRPSRAMTSIAGTILAVSYLGLLGSFIVQLRWLEGPSQGLLALLFLIATAKGADIGAYIVGRLAGRHKLWPILSPNKTIEGAIGGLCFSVLGALLIAAIARNSLGLEPLSTPAVVAYGLIVSVAAQVGDLMESMIKRDCERKDASSVVPGFGGVLDVLDSLLFAGPIAFGFWVSFAA